MDIRKVYRGISSKLLEDFNISSEINHQGNKGTYREGALKDFLNSGRLPKRYGIGSGEIIGPTRNVSKQTDLIIYDKIEGISLIYNDNIQVYPIESVIGVIEVKSKLSKTELYNSLENIKSTKELCPDDAITSVTNSFFYNTRPRSKPFGIVFAYSLANNSLESLTQNLRDWESKNSKEFWPNLIVVLGEGIIHHCGKGIRHYSLFSNDVLKKATDVLYIAYRDDTLFHFYSTLIDLCSQTSLGPVNLKQYFDPAEQIREYTVRHHDKMVNRKTNKVYRYNYNFIKKIVTTCKASGKISNKEMFLKQLGTIPTGCDEDFLNEKVYFYDPEHLPRLDLNTGIDIIEGKPVVTERTVTVTDYIEVNRETYYFPTCYVTDKDSEECDRNFMW